MKWKFPFNFSKPPSQDYTKFPPQKRTSWSINAVSHTHKSSSTTRQTRKSGHFWMICKIWLNNFNFKITFCAFVSRISLVSKMLHNLWICFWIWIGLEFAWNCAFTFWSIFLGNSITFTGEPDNNWTSKVAPRAKSNFLLSYLGITFSETEEKLRREESWERTRKYGIAKSHLRAKKFQNVFW